MRFWVHTFKNCEKNMGSPGLFRNYSAKHKQQPLLRKNRKHDKEVRTGKEMSDFIIMLNFLLCRYYWEHISRSLCRTEMIIRLVLVIIRKWKKNDHSPDECFYVVFCKSLGSHQKVVLRTLTLAESKDNHQPRQPGWHAWGFVKYILVVLLLDHKLLAKEKNRLLWALEQKTYVLHEQCMDIA